MSEVVKENKMGTMAINKLLISMAVPMMVSMLVQALYNIVDSMFVARVSQDALTAVSLAFSMQNLMIAITVGTGVGVNAILSKSLGEKRFDRANKVANNSIFLAGCTYVLFLILGLTVTEKFFAIQTDDAAIMQCGIDYLSVVLTCSFGLVGQVCLERLLTSTGKTFYSMIVQMTGAVANMILDPIMIFGYFGFPALGVKGAAVATVIGQCIAMCVGIIINIKKNKEITLSFKLMKPDAEIIKRIYKVGVPSIIMSSISSIMVFGLNKILIGFTTTAVAVFGVYFKLQSFVFMPVFGLNNGMVPIVAYNYGAKNSERIIQTIKYAIGYAFTIMVFGFLLFEIFPSWLLGIFKSENPAENAAMMEIGIPALRVIAIHFVIAGVCIIMGSVFQALGKAMYSMVVSVCRQLVVLLPAAYLLSLTGNLNMIWFAFPIAECVSLLISTISYRKVRKLFEFKSTDESPAPKYIEQ